MEQGGSTMKATAHMETPQQGVWDYVLAFGLATVGRVLRDWQYARKAGKPVQLADIIPAALYSGITAVIIGLAARWYLPDQVNTTLIALFSLVAGVGSVDLAGVCREFIFQLASRIAPLDKKRDTKE